MKKLLIFVFSCLPVFAGDSNPVVSSKEPRETIAQHPVSAELRAKFWRAVAEQQSARALMDRAIQNAKAVETEIRKECADRLITMDASGEPACGGKPESPDSSK